MNLPDRAALDIPTLGPARVSSPLRARESRFVDEARRVLVPNDTVDLEACLAGGRPVPSFEAAGPRERIFFEPERLTCGLVTCGGLCPGLNNVIRSIVHSLHHRYGVRRILGFRYGFAGLAGASGLAPLELTAEVVTDIHEDGGTLLGTSRGQQDVGDMVDTLERNEVGILFTLGGDGTLRGAEALTAEIARRGREIAVIAVPKTIDNDLEWTERTFGFATAVEEAVKAIAAAHNEARSARNGVGLVKLMGRYSGFIAAHASLASADVNFCLIPESPFDIEGEGGFLAALEARLDAKPHAVVVVAEGAGQEFFGHEGPPGRDRSGNVRLHDIGPLLRDRIEQHFAGRGKPVTMKYIDPSYMIRGLPAGSMDAKFCLILGQHAAHAGMAGRTGMMVGYWNHHFTHVPLALVAGRRCHVDVEGEVWARVLGATGQPASMRSGAKERPA